MELAVSPWRAEEVVSTAEGEADSRNGVKILGRTIDAADELNDCNGVIGEPYRQRDGPGGEGITPRRL